jgi:NADPH:quinone reductase-like Zn-dependent oxidoreductase
LEELPVPVPLPGQIRVKVKAVSFNPVDYQIRKGGPESAALVSNILGRDLSGIVDEVADDVEEYKKGDEVISYVGNLGSSGTYAEYVCIPAAIAGRKPRSLTHEQASTIPVAGLTARFALHKTQADSSKSLFIAGGAGGVGTYAIMLAQQMGIKKIVTTAGNDTSRAYLQDELQLNKKQIIDYKQDNFIEKAIEINDGLFSIALDLVGGKMLSACCQLLDIDGNLASITESPTAYDFDILFLKNASFHSIGTNVYSFLGKEQYWIVYQQLLNSLAALFDNGQLMQPPITIAGDFSVETVKKAHALLEKGTVQGKLVMTC